MKIKGIELKNYRLYKGINQVVFPNGNNKNLYLISVLKTAKGRRLKTFTMNTMLQAEQ